MTKPSPAFILEKQSSLNRSTSGQWHLYASHRQELERLIVPPNHDGRICVLGAGNCNDLDLAWLTRVYREVHLVDLDAEALARAAKFQKVEDSGRIHIHGGIDLTGVSHLLGTWIDQRPTRGEVSACTQLAAAPPTELAGKLDGPFDRVLSPCVLSQLLTPLRDTITEAHPGFMPLLSAMRARHFRLMLDLLAPRGRGVFTCDLLSSPTYPDLPRVRQDRLPALMDKMLAAGKCFSGLDPASVSACIKRDGRACSLRGAPPWLWHLGLSKSYLVYAITFDKA